MHYVINRVRFTIVISFPYVFFRLLSQSSWLILTENSSQSKTFKSSMDIIKDYSEYSSIQGLVYLFFPYQTQFGKLFWTLVILLMLALGLYWCTTAYMNWINNPVLTTITTTAYSVKKVRTRVDPTKLSFFRFSGFPIFAVKLESL